MNKKSKFLKGSSPSGITNGSIPQLIRFERYLFVAYSFAMFAHPPRTFWQDAACSLAEPSPGLTANIVSTGSQGLAPQISGAYVTTISEEI